ncbi:MAG: hypothetical protein Q8O67_31540 [Deltaproteobacteria bacterium]|nr:hypothetical protein [Deltaproteobacteria bacterium]
MTNDEHRELLEELLAIVIAELQMLKGDDAGSKGEDRRRDLEALRDRTLKAIGSLP